MSELKDPLVHLQTEEQEAKEGEILAGYEEAPLYPMISTYTFLLLEEQLGSHCLFSALSTQWREKRALRSTLLPEPPGTICILPHLPGAR